LRGELEHLRQEKVAVNVKELEDKVKVLESQVGEVESENKYLQVRLDSTTVDVGDFVSEMNAFIDQHDVYTSQPMDVEESAHDYEDDEDEDEYMDYERRRQP
jgi:phage shock protein A